MPRDTLVQRLNDSYKETTVAYGISADGTLLEIFASADGSFTVAKTTLQGRACVVDVGIGWRMKDQDSGGEPGSGAEKMVPRL